MRGAQTLPEKEARVIAAQVAGGLAYINGPRHRIIHYDLKPANILFNSYGEVKITARHPLPRPPPHAHTPACCSPPPAFPNQQGDWPCMLRFSLYAPR